MAVLNFLRYSLLSVYSDNCIVKKEIKVVLNNKE